MDDEQDILPPKNIVVIFDPADAGADTRGGALMIGICSAR